MTIRKPLILAVVTGALLLSACKPRGETKTLDEIYQISKSRYSSNRVTDLASGETARALQSVSQQMDSLLQAANNKDHGQLTSLSGDVAELLGSLLPHAGFPTRPGLNELITQYRILAASSADQITAQPGVKLLIARTYAALASELETTEFRL